MSHAITFYDVIGIDFANGTESLLRSVNTQDEANRLIAELASLNRQPATFFYYWVARRPARA